jgi:A/G-specific adenine glycosylase
VDPRTADHNGVLHLGDDLRDSQSIHLTSAAVKRLRARLFRWYPKAKRDLPWRGARDPWRILVSEVMLQQTRVAAAIPYYERFLAAFPTPGDLARASDRKLLAIWSGLGYYSRARNLRQAARRIVEQGGFPRTYDALRDLPGVGDYTAAAVASIAFGLPHAAVDGNAIRVLSRLTCDNGDVRSPATRARLAAVAAMLLDHAEPGEWNQAVMELGATVCLPRDPRCFDCPWSPGCAARRHGRQGELPVKVARREAVRIEQTLLVVRRGARVLMRQRPESATRMPGFWELPEPSEVPGARVGPKRGEFRHSITHHLYRIEVNEAVAARAPAGFAWVNPAAVPLATTARKALHICKEL